MDKKLQQTIEKVEANLHELFGFSTKRQKEFEKLYALCLDDEMNRQTADVKSEKDQIGTLYDDGYFLRNFVGEAKDDEGNVQYEMAVHTGRGVPIVRSEKTGRSYLITWQEIISLAQKAGIDNPVEKD